MNVDAEHVMEREEQLDIDEPKMWKVILLNDDYTPMDFVVIILISIFNKTEPEAIELMNKVHEEGSAIIDVYPFDIAETKVKQVEVAAIKDSHPLRCVMEKE